MRYKNVAQIETTSGEHKRSKMTVHFEICNNALLTDGHLLLERNE
jgi:hypothetical protein